MVKIKKKFHFNWIYHDVGAKVYNLNPECGFNLEKSFYSIPMNEHRLICLGSFPLNVFKWRTKSFVGISLNFRYRRVVSVFIQNSTLSRYFISIFIGISPMYTTSIGFVNSNMINFVSKNFLLSIFVLFVFCAKRCVKLKRKLKTWMPKGENDYY